MSKSLLKEMLNFLINEDTASAEEKLHEYLTLKAKGTAIEEGKKTPWEKLESLYFDDISSYEILEESFLTEDFDATKFVIEFMADEFDVILSEKNPDVKSLINMVIGHSEVFADFKKNFKRSGDSVVIGNKTFTNAQFSNLADRLRNALNNARRLAPTVAGTRAIFTLVEPETVVEFKAAIKKFNSENPDEKLKAQYFKRPANKDIATPYIKVWLDGTSTGISKIKRAFFKFVA